MVEGDDIYVVPNFISEGYFTEIVIPRELELAGPVTHRSGKIIKYCEPVGNDPRMVDLLLHRARQVAPNVSPEKTSLLIVGHGTSLNEKSAEAAQSQVRAIREKGIYAEVSEAYMEEAAIYRGLAQKHLSTECCRRTIFHRRRLAQLPGYPCSAWALRSAPTAAASQQEVFRRNPYHLDGRALYYASAIGTEPLMADVILDTIDRFDRKHLYDSAA